MRALLVLAGLFFTLHGAFAVSDFVTTNLTSSETADYGQGIVPDELMVEFDNPSGQGVGGFAKAVVCQGSDIVGGLWGLTSFSRWSLVEELSKIEDGFAGIFNELIALIGVGLIGGIIYVGYKLIPPGLLSNPITAGAGLLLTVTGVGSAIGGAALNCM